MFGGFFGRVRLRVVGVRRHTDSHPDGHHVAFTDRTVRDGTCQIEVEAITAATVDMVAPLTGSGYSISGCSGGGGVSSQGDGGVRMSCKVGTVATINDVMSLEVVEIRAAVAVLRIEPAG